MKKLIDLISSRFFVFVFAVLLQVIWLLLISWGMSSLSAPVTMTADILSILLVLWIVNKEINPSYKLAWTILILVLPVFGMVVYLLFGESRVAKKMTEESDAVVQEIENYFRENDKVREKIEALDEGISNQSAYIRDYAKFPLHSHTSTRYYPLGEAMFLDMLEDLKRAKHFIFLEYFIVDQGVMFDRIVEVLEQKSKEGVDVRLIYDDIGCINTLPPKYYKVLQAKGIKCAAFNPFRPIMSVVMNNRDHRKIFVVDGKVGFTGGINLADEYINVASRFGYWKDTGIRLAGEAVWSMTVMFLQMWNYINHSSEDYKQFMPQVYQKEPFEGDGFVQPYGDTPLDHETVGENIYLNIINHAERYVYIFTPYLIIDNEMLVSLCNAAKRGVDVRIVTPGIPDKKMIFLLTQSHYEPLLKCGVKIYQYTPGFIHAKSFLCDDKIGTVGSINLDYRSLFLHFECGVFMYKTKALMQLKEDCMDTFAASEEMTLEFCRGQNVFIRIFQGMMRLFAPLL